MRTSLADHKSMSIPVTQSASYFPSRHPQYTPHCNSQSYKRHSNDEHNANHTNHHHGDNHHNGDRADVVNPDSDEDDDDEPPKFRPTLMTSNSLNTYNKPRNANHEHPHPHHQHHQQQRHHKPHGQLQPNNAAGNTAVPNPMTRAQAHSIDTKIRSYHFEMALNSSTPPPLSPSTASFFEHEHDEQQHTHEPQQPQQHPQRHDHHNAQQTHAHAHAPHDRDQHYPQMMNRSLASNDDSKLRRSISHHFSAANKATQHRSSVNQRNPAVSHAVHAPQTTTATNNTRAPGPIQVPLLSRIDDDHGKHQEHHGHQHRAAADHVELCRQILHEIECLKSTQTQFAHHLHDMQNTQQTLCNSLRDVSTNMTHIKHVVSQLQLQVQVQSSSSPSPMVTPLVMARPQSQKSVLSWLHLDHAQLQLQQQQQQPPISSSSSSSAPAAANVINEDYETDDDTGGHGGHGGGLQQQGKHHLHGLMDMSMDMSEMDAERALITKWMESHEKERWKLEREKSEFEQQVKRLQSQIEAMAFMRDINTSYKVSIASMRSKQSNQSAKISTPSSGHNELFSPSPQMLHDDGSNMDVGQSPIYSVMNKSIHSQLSKKSHGSHSNASAENDVHIHAHVQQEHDDDETDALGQLHHPRERISPHMHLKLTVNKTVPFSETTTFVDRDRRVVSSRYLSASPTTSMDVDASGDGDSCDSTVDASHNARRRRPQLSIDGNRHGLLSLDDAHTPRGSDMYTPASNADLSTPTTSTYVYHANAPRLIDVDDPYACAVGNGDESMLVEAVQNAVHVNRDIGREEHRLQLQALQIDTRARKPPQSPSTVSLPPSPVQQQQQQQLRHARGGRVRRPPSRYRTSSHDEAAPKIVRARHSVHCDREQGLRMLQPLAITNRSNSDNSSLATHVQFSRNNASMDSLCNSVRPFFDGDGNDVVVVGDGDGLVRRRRPSVRSRESHSETVPPPFRHSFAAAACNHVSEARENQAAALVIHRGCSANQMEQFFAHVAATKTTARHEEEDEEEEAVKPILLFNAQSQRLVGDRQQQKQKHAHGFVDVSQLQKRHSDQFQRRSNPRRSRYPTNTTTTTASGRTSSSRRHKDGGDDVDGTQRQKLRDRSMSTIHSSRKKLLG